MARGHDRVDRRACAPPGALRDFVANFVEHAVDDPAMPLTMGRIRDTRPVAVRTDTDSLSNRMHFSYRAMSPLHTVGPWDGAAAELLLSRVRGLQHRTLGFFATGLPELPVDAVAPAGSVLHHLGHGARR